MGSRKEEDKVLPRYLLKSQLFYPTSKDIVDTNSFCSKLTCEAASIFRVEFRDKRKAAAKYLSEIGGEKSMKKVEKENKTARTRISEINCLSESDHSAATYDLQVCGTIDLQHCGARDHSENNNDFRRDIELLVHGSKAFK